MSSKRGPDTDSRRGGRNTSVTPSTASLIRRLGISPGPRMLTPFEIDLLRSSKREISREVDEALTRRDDTSETLMARMRERFPTPPRRPRRPGHCAGS